MVSNRALANELKRREFVFRRETRKVRLYKRKNSRERIHVSRARNHSPDYATMILRQAGLSEEEIDAFIQRHDR